MSNTKLYLYVAAFVFFGSGGIMIYSKVRGIRNNNPGNVRHGASWQGMSATQTDSAFIQFTSPVYGIRAINKILKTYSARHNINTVEGIINRWAPPNENDTQAYIASVAADLNVTPGQTIDVQSYAPLITQAIIKHENGIQPYSAETIDAGVKLGWA